MATDNPRKIRVSAGLVQADLVVAKDAKVPVIHKEPAYAAVVTIKPKGGHARYFRISKSALTQVVDVVNEDWLHG